MNKQWQEQPGALETPMSLLAATIAGQLSPDKKPRPAPERVSSDSADCDRPSYMKDPSWSHLKQHLPEVVSCELPDEDPQDHPSVHADMAAALKHLARGGQLSSTTRPSSRSSNKLSAPPTDNTDNPAKPKASRGQPRPSRLGERKSGNFALEMQKEKFSRAAAKSKLSSSRVTTPRGERDTPREERETSNARGERQTPREHTTNQPTEDAYSEAAYNGYEATYDGHEAAAYDGHEAGYGAEEAVYDGHEAGYDGHEAAQWAGDEEHHMLNDEAYEMAACVMAAADRHKRNQQLTVNELKTWMPDEPFTEWLTGTRMMKGHMVHYDTNRDGAIDMEELTHACSDYIAEHRHTEYIPPAGVDHPRADRRLSQAVPQNAANARGEELVLRDGTHLSSPPMRQPTAGYAPHEAARGSTEQTNTETAEIAGYLMELFQMGDVDGTGMLSAVELCQMLVQSGFEISDSAMLKIITSAELLEQGMIQYEGFVPVVTQLLEAMFRGERVQYTKHYVEGDEEWTDFSEYELEGFVHELLRIIESKSSGALQPRDFIELMQSSALGFRDELMLQVSKQIEFELPASVLLTVAVVAGVSPN